ncbi:unnamed protein product [Rhizoctonia solani]|uniref:Uncharacterized protein n=1 Tax=Rhizoctonia solani TaxID=456999 RepID=A0A8H3GWK7_9AGAM|nr:unnamed protein product [Rhizoctonia solani]
MATVASSRALGRSSSETYDEKITYIENSEENNSKILDSSLHSSQPNPSAPDVPGSRNVLNRAARYLLKLVSAVQTMRCQSAHNKVPEETRPTYLSQSCPASTIREKSISTLEPNVRHDTSFITNESIRSSLIAHTEKDAWADPSKNNANTFAHSTNTVYQPSALFSDETLRFANALFPSMEPLEIWGTPALAEDNVELPSTRWVRRHTCIRPGHVVQVPSVSNKSAIYFLSCQTELEGKYEVNLDTEKNRSQKLFIAQVGDNAGQPAKHSRAFIMGEPGSEH